MLRAIGVALMNALIARGMVPREEQAESEKKSRAV